MRGNKKHSKIGIKFARAEQSVLGFFRNHNLLVNTLVITSTSLMFSLGVYAKKDTNKATTYVINTPSDLKFLAKSKPLCVRDTLDGKYKLQVLTKKERMLIDLDKQPRVVLPGNDIMFVFGKANEYDIYSVKAIYKNSKIKVNVLGCSMIEQLTRIENEKSTK